MEDNNSIFVEKKRTPAKAYIWDETLRGGEQSPGVIFDLEDKMELAELMDNAGISVIDAGFPMMSQKERETIEALANSGLNAEIGATVRCKKEDIDAAIDLGVENLYMFSTTSKFHLHYKQNMTETECFKEVLEAVDYITQRGVDFDFISEDTTRSDLDFVMELLSEIRERGAERLIICDTASSITPGAMYSFTSKLIDEVGGEGWGVHCHNDFGLAVANTIAAVQAGVNYPTVTVNSLGDSSGNAALEEVVMILEKLFDIDTGIDTTMLYELSKIVERKSGVYLSPQKPISGYNSYRHESEVHVSGVLSHTESYEPISPEEVGREREFVLGKHSGPTNVKELLNSKNISLTNEQIEEVLDKIEEEKTTHRQLDIDKFLEKKKEFDSEMLGFSEDRFWELVSEVKGE